MNILDTLRYLKKDIKATVFGNDINRIVYNDDETFRPTKDQILAVDQAAVEKFIADEKQTETERLRKQKIIEFKQMLGIGEGQSITLDILKTKLQDISSI